MYLNREEDNSKGKILSRFLSFFSLTTLLLLLVFFSCEEHPDRQFQGVSFSDPPLLFFEVTPRRWGRTVAHTHTHTHTPAKSIDLYMCVFMTETYVWTGAAGGKCGLSLCNISAVICLLEGCLSLASSRCFVILFHSAPIHCEPVVATLSCARFFFVSFFFLCCTALCCQWSGGR